MVISRFDDGISADSVVRAEDDDQSCTSRFLERRYSSVRIPVKANGKLVLFSLLFCHGERKHGTGALPQCCARWHVSVFSDFYVTFWEGKRLETTEQTKERIALSPPLPYSAGPYLSGAGEKLFYSDSPCNVCKHVFEFVVIRCREVFALDSLVLPTPSVGYPLKVGE